MRTAILALYALALAVWAGGLVVLGAIVAPTVFGIVPAPTSAHAMTVVFRRFDGVAIACAVIALLAEAALAWRGGRRFSGWSDVARGGATTVAAALAITEGAWLSPRIQGLHQGGAVRGFGDAGLELEHLHRIAESLAKTELALLAAALVLLVARAGRGAS
jgi:hypothetical protein